MKNIFKIVKHKAKKELKKIVYSKKQKIFCIGQNKTGTTSLREALLDLGFTTGSQREAELMFDDWVKRDFRNVIDYCKTADFFQDQPFSLPFTFIALDQAFPNSKFILTVRNSAEEWYHSLINFYGKVFGNGNIPPTVTDLKNAEYIWKGQPYYVHIHVNNVTDDNLFDKKALMNTYLMHNEMVKDYFRWRPKDLLVLNLSEMGAYKQLCQFLEIESNKTDFPWKNKTKDIGQVKK